MEKYLAVLIASHFIADFLLQPDGLANKKRRPFYLFIHAVIHALATYILLQNWSGWQVPLLIFVFHIAIDYIKQVITGETESAKVLVADQAVHIASLLIYCFACGTIFASLSFYRFWLQGNNSAGCFWFNSSWFRAFYWTIYERDF
jgi:hypothetical protein